MLNRGELARFQRLISVKADGCWEWKGALMPNGYGKHRIGPGHPERAAHRISYEHYQGKIPDGLQLDHKCRNRRCVRPAHLEPVTGSVNTDRQDHANRRKTHCPAGHEYDDENTAIRAGKRYCRECDKIRRRQQRANVEPARSEFGVSD